MDVAEAGVKAARIADLERARGALRLSVRSDGAESRVRDLRQSGCGRFLFPARAAAQPLEAVVVNTAGGLTGGDRFDAVIGVEAGASALVTTQACEKIYRAAGPAAIIATALRVENDARLRWLPQETILFERSALRRSLTIDMAEEADVLAGEAVILGRQAMGEELFEARFRDRWRVRRGGRLVFAEDTSVDGGWDRLRAGRAGLGGAAALATILHAAPDAGSRVDAARAIIDASDIDGGASAFDGLLVMRLLAPSGLALRGIVVRLLELCAGVHLPRVWMT